jgi:hypothetical protein
VTFFWGWRIYVHFILPSCYAPLQPIIKKKKEGEEKRMTQEEMLLEAAETGFKLCFQYNLSKSI